MAVTQPAPPAPDQAVTQQQLGVPRPIHPVQPTFGMRANQQLVGHAPIGPAAGNRGGRGGRGGPGKGKKGHPGRGGGPGDGLRDGGPGNGRGGSRPGNGEAI